ncbi:MAG: asparagine synthetase A [Desulfurococcaceae archaeon TW002]
MVGRVVGFVSGCLVRVSVGGFLVDVELGDSLCSDGLLSVIKSGREVFLKLFIDEATTKVLGVAGVGEVPLKNFYVDASKPEVFARYSWFWLRFPRYSKIIRFQHLLLKTLREILDSEGFIELLPPVLNLASDPGLRGARKVPVSVYGSTYELCSSTIMYKQLAATALGKIYFVARNVREEPVENIKTGRHLIEFTQLDLEWAGASMNEVMSLGEKLVYESCLEITEKARELIEEFNPRLKCFKPPYEKITFSEALNIVREAGIRVSDSRELPQEAEEVLSVKIGKPFWLIKFPTAGRGFYYMPDEEEPDKNQDFNLIMPEGYGELIDGGVREYRHERIVRRLKELGEDLSKYSWFLEALKSGIAPTAGFGLGIERYTIYLLNLKYIWEAAPFPKPPGVVNAP